MATEKYRDAEYRSTTAGKTWRIGPYKPQGLPAYITASEGTPSEDGRSWSTVIGFGMPGGDRRFRFDLPGGRMTAKAVAAGMADAVAKMRAAGLIEGEAIA